MRVGYIGNFYKIPEYILHSDFELDYVIIEEGALSDEFFTFLKVRDIPFKEVKNSKELNDLILSTGIETWITCSYGKRIHIEELKCVKIFNIHYAALPNYKGRHPTFFATMANELSVGVSLHKVTQKLDEGSIIAQKKVPYYFWENENDIFTKLTNEIPQLLKELNCFLQDENSYSCIENTTGDYYPPVSSDDYTIHIHTDSPDTIFNKVRAQAKYKGALFVWDGIRYWVHSVLFSKEKSEGKLCVPKDDYFVVMDVSREQE